MTSICISKPWYDEIKDKVEMSNPYEFTEAGWVHPKVEVDVKDINKFNEVSRNLGWM